VSAPAATECTDIFHQKLITVTAITTNVAAKMNDFRKNGIWNLKII
jgi:hypothetical protein